MRADNTATSSPPPAAARGLTRPRPSRRCAHSTTPGTRSPSTPSPGEAGVSRSWLYTQPDLRAEIERLRERQQSAPSRILPDRQRASDASLLRRLEIATARVRRLEADNGQLRDALAQALGENRAAVTVTGAATRRDNENPRLPDLLIAASATLSSSDHCRSEP